MAYKGVFKRYELKYLISAEQCDMLRELIKDKMHGDEYGVSTINSLYFDTKTHLLARRSMRKPYFKEKFRLRVYGTPKPDGVVFAEIKRKVNSVVYKRRIPISVSAAENFISGKSDKLFAENEQNQIAKEIDYMINYYGGLRPSVMIVSEREAFFANDDSNFRLTIDKNIRWRDAGLSFYAPHRGEYILKENPVLVEVKVSSAIPLWLTDFLSKNKIYRTSFSKLGRACTTLFGRELI